EYYCCLYYTGAWVF
nr:immunoglobulin light chain junction region [Macaca mulatta]MOX79863.1 immunoglobulin light chain junction region [Macaca mulatta]MOX82276.1 immunoglobulin light chain junction region [Macaca mulatta]MOX82719.1 immunoglobulin light chain junction region [Macaca mulatta]MOX83036.1 immunoglobulin light chain junction region [Macaca mulatta]